MPRKIQNQTVPVTPKFKIREEQDVYHHCFKLIVATMKKNLSWRKDEVILENVDHCHFFHNINSLGMAQKVSNAVGGHFHDVTWKIDAEGYPVATCGPALKKIVKKLPNGSQKTEIVKIKWYDANTEKTTVDEHTHKMDYLHTNRLTMGKAQNYKTSPIEQEIAAAKQLAETGG